MYIDSINLKNSKIYMGQMPLPKTKHFPAEDISNLKRLNIHTAFVLSTDEDLKNYQQDNLFVRYKSMGIKVIHYPIEDYWVPEDMEGFDGVITYAFNLLKSGHNILVHCNAGLGRTGLFVIGLLIKIGLSLPSAFSYARKRRPGLVESQYQILFLKKYERFIKNDKIR